MKNKLIQAWSETESEHIAHHTTRKGIYLEFKGEPGFDLATKSLEDMRSKKVRLLNIRDEITYNNKKPNVFPYTEVTTIATIYVDNDKKNHFFNKIEQYAKEDTPSGKPKNNNLISSISNIQKVHNIESFWVDTISLIPNKKPEWCEVWLSNETDETLHSFDQLLQRFEIKSKPGFIRFPERIVKVILVDGKQLEQLTIYSDDIAEYRKAKETSSFWLEMKNIHQVEWVKDLQERIRIKPDLNTSICILDTGVNNGHPLLSPLLSDKDCHSVNLDWGTHDHHSHGSLMAGVAAYGDLATCLSSAGLLEMGHCLESVKILPLPPEQTEPNLWGLITTQGISRAEIEAPQRNRIICMAISSLDSRDCGRPTSWSGQIDQLASGSIDDNQRLIVVCAGNINDLSVAKNYPEAQITDSIHDPGQSWNALTVGAYTRLDQIQDPTMAGYKSIAPKDGLSPFSTTSSLWNDAWPIKPEIVMEGGNFAIDGDGFTSVCDDLSLLSTHYKPQEAHFYPFKMTSASTAYV